MTGKVAIVTGAASGIGRAVARALATKGVRVAVADLNEPEAASLVEAIRSTGGEAIAVRLDVTSESAWEAALARLHEHWERLDICVNCAGIAFAKRIADLDLTEWRRVIGTNLDGVFLGTKHALLAMSRGTGGCIINIASAAGIKPVVGNAAYGTSKAAIRFFTRVAALEAAAHKVRVVSISPGAVATPMWKPTELWPKETERAEGPEAALNNLIVERGFARAEEVATAVLFLASDDAAQVTGTDLAVDNGFSIG